MSAGGRATRTLWASASGLPVSLIIALGARPTVTGRFRPSKLGAFPWGFAGPGCPLRVGPILPILRPSERPREFANSISIGAENWNKPSGMVRQRGFRNG